jgi:hypothetical protein
MHIINRSSITISFKKPFADWINKLDPEHPVQEMMLGESSTYLIKEMFDNAGDLIKKRYKDIFENELMVMWTDENDWPSNRTFKMFNEWFAYEISGFVYDTMKSPIERSIYEI